MEENEAVRLNRVSLQVTPEQRAWLDARARRNQTYSRAAEARSVIQEAMDQEARAAIAAGALVAA